MGWRSLWLLLVLLGGGPLRTTAAAPPPNVLFIFSDDQGSHDVGCYGSEIATPQIDSIAKNGVKFTAFYVASPVCTPSRFGLLTGRYPGRAQSELGHALMFLDAKDDVVGIRTNETTIATVLQGRGYHTALIGKWHLGHGAPEFLPNRHGFAYAYGSQGGCVNYETQKYGHKPDWFHNGEPLKEKGYTTDLITADALRYLTARAATNQPFFLYLAYTAPHYGKGWDEKTGKLSNILQAKEKDRARNAAIADPDRREYAGMVTALDDGVGRVLALLREKNLLTNTLVVFACDNGADPHYGGSNEPLRGQKAQLFEGGIRVPCLVQWPGQITAGRVIATPATALDWFPTLAALAGAEAQANPGDGQSLLPLLREENPLPARDLVWTYKNADALRRGDWKYVHTGKDETFLFNLAADPLEQTNLAPARPELVKELEEAHAKVAKGFNRK